MGFVCKIILLGGLLWFGMFTIGKGTSFGSNHWTSKDFTCKNTLRVYFKSETWTSQIGEKGSPRYINQSQFFGAVMDEIVTTADGNGIQCTFDKLGYLLTCCDLKNFDRFYSVDKREWIAHSKFWDHDDMLRLNCVFLFVNLFFFLVIFGWAILTLGSNNREEGESIEMF